MPERKKAHKIEHICCGPDRRFKAEGGRHLYQCTGCGVTDRGTDREPAHAQWRHRHLGQCFNKEDTRMEDEGTQAEFVAAAKRGEIPGVKFNQYGPRNARFTWEVK